MPAFLDLDLPGSKVVVGSGPSRDELMRRYPAATFLIASGDGELGRLYASADTFGSVMLEAVASGVPVAAFPVPGPLDVIGDSGGGRPVRGPARSRHGGVGHPARAMRSTRRRLLLGTVAEQFAGNLAFQRPKRKD